MNSRDLNMTVFRRGSKLMQLTRYVVAVAAAIVALATPHLSQANPSMCNGSNGAICTTKVPVTDFSYSICEDHAPTIGREYAWCMVFGMTWDYDHGTCLGAPAESTTPGNASAESSRFTDIVHPVPPARCGGTAGPWTCSNWQCDCRTSSVNGMPETTVSTWSTPGGDLQTDGSCSYWQENFVLRGHRDFACPPGYQSNALDDGTIECYKLPFCEKCVGNPIDAGNGDKLQQETDYRSPAPGGLSFTRYYNSGGFWDSTPRDMVLEDFWRTSYTARIQAVTGNSALLGAALRPTGAVRFFDLSGHETRNDDGAAYSLQRFVDGGGNTTGWQLTAPEKDIEAYDALGRLTSITTRAGFVTTIAYDANGRLSTATDSYGRSLTLGYDTSGRMSSMTDPAGQTYQYGYDAKGRLATFTYPDTKIRTYLYEDANWKWALTGIVDERNKRLSTYAYDTQGRGISTEHAAGRGKVTLSWASNAAGYQANTTDAFGTAYNYHFAVINGSPKMVQDGNFSYGYNMAYRTYDTNGNLGSVTDRNGNVTTYAFDSVRNLETSRTEAYGTPHARTITTTWNATHRLPATITRPSGVSGVNEVTTFTYDTAGNLTKKNVTAGTLVREWNYTYNARGQVLTMDGPRTDVTDVTTVSYYADNDTCTGCRGQVHTVTNALGHVTTFNTYDLDGRPTQVTDANGVSTTLTYKTRGWLASRTIGGETTSYDYDDTGNLTKVTLPDNSWVMYAYDDADALIGIDDSLGNAIDYEVDLLGNRTKESVYDPQNQLKKRLQHLFSPINRLDRDLDADTNATAYAYDAEGNTTSVTDPLTHATINTYDPLNRLKTSKDANNYTTTFGYDAQDRLTSVQDPRSLTTTYGYDSLGNLMSQSSPDTGGTTFTYDAAGNVLTKTDARNVTTTYSYDALNRVVTATVTDGTVTYEYDNTTTGGAYAKGRLTKVTDPSGFTTYVYDALGRVTAKSQTVNATANKTFTLSYTYANGRQTGVMYPSGRAITYGFNTQGQVTSIAVDGTTLLSSASYFPFGPSSGWTWSNGQLMQRGFDQNGRINTMTLGPSNATYADLSQAFGYDSVNRLLTANLAAGQSQSFTYDANGNRATSTVNAASTTYNYPATSHRLTSLTGSTAKSFAYDDAGNLTSNGLTFVYDGRGRMKQGGAVSYLVNGLGQRVKKAAGSDTFFAYDEAGHLVGEYDASGAPVLETVWLGDLPVGVVKPKTGGFDLFYVWADHLGSPRAISDTANVSRWEWAHSDPFGANLPNENPAGAGTFTYNLRFAGQYFDSETGTHYNYFRDYDPSLGRYVESDPIGLGGGINTYAYGLENPLNNSDPDGLQVAQGIRIGSRIGASIGTAIEPGGGTAIGALIGAGVGAGIGYLACEANSAEDQKKKNCQALKDSILATCASLSGRKKFACFAAAQRSYEQCMSQD